MNKLLINEFSKLIAFIKEQTDEYQAKKDLKKVSQNNFRIKQLSVVLSILKKYPMEILKLKSN
jgi:hypothetical protein